jgi:hypothetical protein
MDMDETGLEDLDFDFDTDMLLSLIDDPIEEEQVVILGEETRSQPVVSEGTYSW